MEGMLSDRANLILNEDGSIYHLRLQPDEIAETILTVGDPERVSLVLDFFDEVEFVRRSREFVSATGHVKEKRITVVSTGIGTDNVDIVLNELDALVNIDFASRKVKPSLISLEIVRLGTAGGLQPELAVDSFVVSEFALGFDNLINFYHYIANLEEVALQKAIADFSSKLPFIPYVVQGTSSLIERFKNGATHGLTATCCGFYGPQGRQLRAPVRDERLLDTLTAFKFAEYSILNLEMETAGLYCLGTLLGHQVCSLSTLINNRSHGVFTNNLEASISSLIEYTLEQLVA